MAVLAPPAAPVPSPPAAAAAPDPVPLVVDLDGSLLRTHSLIESIFVLARQQPMSLFALPFWWLRGRAYLKHQVAARAMPDAHAMPYRAEVLEFLREQSRQHRPLALATDADQRFAEEVARELGLFSTVIGSDGIVNLKGRCKRDRLVERFGERGFDYLGRSGRDYPIWCAARRALIVSPNPALARRVSNTTPVQIVSGGREGRWPDYLNALRPPHWVKNGLVFVPLATVHRLFEPALLERAALAFIAFDFCASGVYLFNDLLDLPADRRHPYKKDRMLASGRIRLGYALMMMPILILAAGAIAWHLSAALLGVLGLYVALMIAYSMGLKDIALVDVLVLAGGYALRVAAGAVAADIRVSAWLLTLCMFLFFSLALIKRYAELVVLESQPGAGAAHARGYLSGDKTTLAALGIASGYLAVMVLALYTNTEISQRLYARHDYFWGICLLLLYWISYLWMMATRGRIIGDPVIFALSDRASLCAIAGMGLFAGLAL